MVINYYSNSGKLFGSECKDWAIKKDTTVKCENCLGIKGLTLDYVADIVTEPVKQLGSEFQNVFGTINSVKDTFADIEDINDFKTLLSLMDNEDFANFMTHFCEDSYLDFAVMKVGRTKGGGYDWAGYYLDINGAPSTERGGEIVDMILRDNGGADYVVIDDGDNLTMKFLSEDELRDYVYSHGMFKNLWEDQYCSWRCGNGTMFGVLFDYTVGKLNEKR